MTAETTAPDGPAEVTDTADSDTGGAAEDKDTGAEDGKGNHESAKWRRKLRDAEAANEVLVAEHAARVADLKMQHGATTAMLTAQRQAILDATLANAGLDTRLASAAGITIDSVLTDDGLIDGRRLSEAVSAAMKEFGISPRSGRGRTSSRANHRQGLVALLRGQACSAAAGGADEQGVPGRKRPSYEVS